MTGITALLLIICAAAGILLAHWDMQRILASSSDRNTTDPKTPSTKKTGRQTHKHPTINK